MLRFFNIRSRDTIPLNNVYFVLILGAHHRTECPPDARPDAGCGQGQPAASTRSYPGNFKGIVQPFELGGVTRLIRSAVKFCMAGNLKKKLLTVQSHERSLKLICAA